MWSKKQKVIKAPFQFMAWRNWLKILESWITKTYVRKSWPKGQSTISMPGNQKIIIFMYNHIIKGPICLSENFWKNVSEKSFLCISSVTTNVKVQERRKVYLQEASLRAQPG